MQKVRITFIVVAVTLAVALTIACPARAENVNLDEALKTKLKNHEDQMSQDLFNQKGLKLRQVTFKGSLDAFSFELKNKNLPTNPTIAGKQEVRNCGSENVVKNFEFSKTEQQSSTITNSTTLSTSVSTTVSAEVPFSGGGVESSFSIGMDTSKSISTEKMKSNTWTDATNVTILPKKHAKVQFIIKESTADEIPYTGYFVAIGPAEVTMGDGRVELYEHTNFKGWMQYYNVGDQVPWITDRWNDQVSSIKFTGSLSITVYEHRDYGGRTLTFSQSIPDLRDHNFNDIISSFKVGGGTKTIQLDKYLSKEDRSIKIEGMIKAAQGVESYVTVIDQDVDCKPAVAASAKKPAKQPISQPVSHKVFTASELKNVKVEPGGEIISTKLRPGAKRIK